MRLIDADAWIEKLSKSFITPNYHPDLGDAFQCMEAEKHNEQIAELIMQIANQPTAYDVEKVVEELENKMFSAECYNDDFNGCEIGNLLCMGDVYEIVKRGGVE